MSVVDTIAEFQPLRIDWARCMREIQLFGWTPYKVALTLCADPQTAYAWAKGAEPRHSYGAALLNLHRAVCGEDYSQKLNRESRPR